MKVLAATTSPDSRTGVPAGEGAMRYASPVKDSLRGGWCTGHAQRKTRSRATESIQWRPAFRNSEWDYFERKERKGTKERKGKHMRTRRHRRKMR